ncbi:septation protein SepH, partial [Stomatohabitans albus]
MYNGELVGYTADLSHLVVAVDGLPQRVRIPLTQAFADTVAELMVGRSQHDGQGGGVMATRLLRDPRVQERAALAADREASRLSPKAIQRRLRAGDSPEAVAKAAGTSVAHILRWYQPIKAEQDQLIDIVRGAVQERASLGYSSVPIGDAVIEHLRDHGVNTETIRWTAAKPDNRDTWVVSVH